MQAFTMPTLIDQQVLSGQLYLEFLREPSLSMGLYVLPAGSHDPQQPHAEDEVYYVVSGRAMITVGGEAQAVAAGSIVFVAAKVPHQFHNIQEELTVLVFFAPAETAVATTQESKQ